MTKAQILAKYSDIINSKTNFSYGRKKIDLAKNRMLRARKSLLKVKDLFKRTPDTSSEASNLRDDYYSKVNTFNKYKSEYRDLKNKEKLKDMGLTYNEATLSSSEKEAMENVRRQLDSYTAGDMTIDKFYHQYGFDMVTDEALYAFVKGEGLI